MPFNDEAINTIFDKIVSYAMGTGRFDLVNQHEPKSSPGTGMICAVWVQQVSPVRTSGLGAISGLLVLQARVYTNFRQQPYDMIDPDVTAAASDLMGALAGDFDLGGDANVRAIDLLGQSGYALGFHAGFVEIDRQMFRIVTITVPVIINDMFQVGALWILFLR